jgi:hypothetical protein
MKYGAIDDVEAFCKAHLASKIKQPKSRGDIIDMWAGHFAHTALRACRDYGIDPLDIIRKAAVILEPGAMLVVNRMPDDRESYGMEAIEAE